MAMALHRLKKNVTTVISTTVMVAAIIAPKKFAVMGSKTRMKIAMMAIPPVVMVALLTAPLKQVGSVPMAQLAPLIVATVS